MSLKRNLGASARSAVIPGAAALVVLIVALALATGSGSSSMKGMPMVETGKSATLTISNFMYSPDSLTVRAGTKIRITNRDGTAHTLTADNGAFDSGTIGAGQTRDLVISKPGTYTFHCLFHAFMTGTIKVVG
jgi:plastocyanin